MNKRCKHYIIVFLIGLFANTSSQAWQGSVAVGNHHHHNYNYDHHRYYYDRGGYAGPNVVIELPAKPYYYPRQCEEVEVCNVYNQCWLEDRCQD